MKLLLIPDVPGWAWDHKANALMRHLKDKYEITKYYYREVVSNLNENVLKEFDAVHSFGWAESPWINLCTTGVSSHNFRRDKPKASKIISKYKGVTAVSRIILNELKGMNIKSPLYLCENGVETDWFIPSRKRNNIKKFIVGWSGQRSRLPYDQHGYLSLALPLKEKLAMHRNIEFKMITNSWDTAVPHREMVDFYHSIDLMVHTGHMTGTPNPIFEAASCGKAVMSTRIGSANDMIKNGLNGYLFPCNNIINRSYAKKLVDGMYSKILQLSRSRDLCAVLGENARTTVVKDWTWAKRSQDWCPVFDNHRIDK